MNFVVEPLGNEERFREEGVHNQKIFFLKENGYPVDPALGTAFNSSCDTGTPE